MIDFCNSKQEYKNIGLEGIENLLQQFAKTVIKLLSLCPPLQSVFFRIFKRKI